MHFSRSKGKLSPYELFTLVYQKDTSNVLDLIRDRTLMPMDAAVLLCHHPYTPHPTNEPASRLARSAWKLRSHSAVGAAAGPPKQLRTHRPTSQDVFWRGRNRRGARGAALHHETGGGQQTVDGYGSATGRSHVKSAWHGTG